MIRSYLYLLTGLDFKKNKKTEGYEYKGVVNDLGWQNLKILMVAQGFQSEVIHSKKSTKVVIKSSTVNLDLLEKKVLTAIASSI